MMKDHSKMSCLSNFGKKFGKALMDYRELYRLLV